MGSFIRRAMGTMIIPIGVVAVVLTICAVNGVSLFPEGSNNPMLLAQNTAKVALVAMALALNLNSGRFDFSLGAVALASSAIGATTALKFGDSLPVMATATILAGVVLGAISGLIYVTLRISPLVSSLGVTLLYEGLANLIGEGTNITFNLKFSLLWFAKSIPAMLVVIVVAVGLVWVIFDRSRFGSNYRALISGQTAAVSAGVKEKSNAVLTYAATGALMGAYGLITASAEGRVSSGAINFATIGVMFTAFLPMFIGGYIGRFSNDKLGYLLGAFATTFIALSYSALNLTDSEAALWTAGLLVAFLIFLSNEERATRWWRRLRATRRAPSDSSGSAAPQAPAPVTTGASAS